MRQKSNSNALSSEEMVKGIRRATRKRYSAEEKIRIVLDGLRGEHSIAELCRREGIAEGLYYSWSKEFLEAGKRRRLDQYPCSRPFRPRTAAFRRRTICASRDPSPLGVIYVEVPGSPMKVKQSSPSQNAT